MTVLWTIQNGAEFKGASIIFEDGEVYPVNHDHPRYADITEHLMNDVDDDDRLLNMVNPFDAIYRSLFRLSERVSRKGMVIYLDGDPLETALTKHIVRILDSGDQRDDSWKAYVAFLEKLATNPSKASQDHLYHYIENHNITLHPDGDLVLYKGVADDNLSLHAGYGIVDGKEYSYAQLPNFVGSIVEIPRSMVDDNRNNHCSSGLHAGTFKYATEFAPKLLTVKVNPRDVVSVPSDYSNAKVRISRYLILEENKGEYTSPVLKPNESVVPAQPKVKSTKKKKKAKAVPTVVSPQYATKVDEFKAKIVNELVPAGITNLSAWKNRKVTKARRAEFQAAIDALGLK